jgi:hypothetical protein
MGRELNNLKDMNLELEDLDLLNTNYFSDIDLEEVDSENGVHGGDN